MYYGKLVAFQNNSRKNSITQGKNSKLKTKTQGFGKVENAVCRKRVQKKAWHNHLSRSSRKILDSGNILDFFCWGWGILWVPRGAGLWAVVGPRSPTWLCFAQNRLHSSNQPPMGYGYPITSWPITSWSGSNFSSGLSGCMTDDNDNIF